MKTVAAWVYFNRKFVDKKLGGEIEVFRGIHGNQAKELMPQAKIGRNLSVKVNSLSSFTTDKEEAVSWGSSIISQHGIVFSAKVKSSDVLFTAHTDQVLDSEKEVIFSDGGNHTATVKVVSVYRGQ